MERCHQDLGAVGVKLAPLYQNVHPRGPPHGTPWERPRRRVRGVFRPTFRPDSTPARRRNGRSVYHTSDTEFHALMLAAAPREPEVMLVPIKGDRSRGWNCWAAIPSLRCRRVNYATFQESQGETLHDFLQRTRQDLPRRLLGDRRLAIKEVAQGLNFSSESRFGRFFQRGAGMSPARFRERCRA